PEVARAADQPLAARRRCGASRCVRHIPSEMLERRPRFLKTACCLRLSTVAPPVAIKSGKSAHRQRRNIVLWLEEIGVRGSHSPGGCERRVQILDQACERA